MRKQSATQPKRPAKNLLQFRLTGSCQEALVRFSATGRSSASATRACNAGYSHAMSRARSGDGRREAQRTDGGAASQVLSRGRRCWARQGHVAA
jgi:hypothetical protein